MVSPTHSPIENASHARHSISDSEMNRVLSSTWHVLEQTPPPSLRDVLGAYNSKGDGDRDMLIAMLNAKSAEEQRMASVAALHRTLLEMHHSPPVPSHSSLLPIQPTTHSYPPRSISHSPPTHEIMPPHILNGLPMGYSSPPLPPPAVTREAPPHNIPSRKRQRTSHEPPSPHRAVSSQYLSMRHDNPPSPHSSSRSDSAEYSPRSRPSMAIGSLLSSGDIPRGGTHTSEGRTNDYISPSTSIGPISV